MKKYLPDCIVIVAFIAISFAYFFPSVIEGRILFQHDIQAGAGAGQEVKEFYEETGERSRWTNALFSGMPTYQISPSYDSTDSVRFVEKAYHLFLPNYVWLTFVMMLGFYILLRSMGLSAWLSALGGLIWGFSSYFFILISAGHIWKFVALAYIPPTIAGIVLAYRKKYILGGILTAFFLALQILANHVQMSYYFMFVILFIVIAFFINAYRKKELPSFFKATGVLAIAAIIGISINLSNLYHTYQYSKETMRGKSELVFEGEAAGQTSGGLDRDYITQWSYGIGETFTLLVPNVKGGASVPLSMNDKAMQKANPMYRGLYSQLTQYFGDQPMTAGPVYVGAFVLMLFFLGIFFVKGPFKWALVAATVLSILLSWGRNFMGFTDFFIDFIPMYDKFRAVSSILVIAEFTIPLLAILGLKAVIDKPELLKDKKAVWVSFGLTGGIALLFALFPGLFFSNYVPSNEMAALQRAIPADQLGPIITNLTDIRQSLLTSDAWRSFFIVIIGTVLLWAFSANKLKKGWLVAGIAFLCLGDMWLVNKRYLNNDQFVPDTQTTAVFRKSAADEFILRDTDPNYRVLNVAGNTFNENNTSYWHKSIGGYHAAKLRRYQEMIDHHIVKDMRRISDDIVETQGDLTQASSTGFPILNMLNTKYIIFPGGERQTIPVQNPYANGHAWFVQDVMYVDNANEEIDALDTIDPRQIAVADMKFKAALNGLEALPADSSATVELQSYEPNRLVYQTSSATDGVVVFSEIYYPGWTVTIDGAEAELGRADYILRAMYVPAGNHTIEMVFRPQSIRVTETIAYIGIALLLAGIIFLLIRYRKKLNPEYNQ